MERLDKILAGSGEYSRSQARALIAAGEVTVDGVTVRSPEKKVSRDSDIIAGGQPVDTAEHVYIMLNKPEGYESATKDGFYPAVTRLLPQAMQNRGVFPVGRLDADVTGLLILTDDGGYAHRVTAPKNNISKIYELHTDAPMTDEDIASLAAGVCLRDGTEYKPAVLAINPEDATHCHVTVTEGKFHEVKNLIASCGKKILRMRRVCIGGLHLDETLALGAFRRMTIEEKSAVLELR